MNIVTADNSPDGTADLVEAARRDEPRLHLLRRAGFGGPPSEVQRLAGLGLERAVEDLVDFPQEDPDLEAAIARFLGTEDAILYTSCFDANGGLFETLLGEDDLASGDLARFDTIVTGTRAYAIRDDLRRHNRRLLDWVRGGGRMVVLYNTPEFVPDELAPYDGTLPSNAEEVSEQAAAVEILAPTHAFFTTPNRITDADFVGWIEQRGSKFFASWDAKYTPLLSSHDQGQPAQRGGWLTASVGKGRWTYMAYALHRQLPYGVPGAYRLTANLLALGKRPPR